MGVSKVMAKCMALESKPPGFDAGWAWASSSTKGDNNIDLTGIAGILKWAKCLQTA